MTTRELILEAPPGPLRADSDAWRALSRAQRIRGLLPGPFRMELQKRHRTCRPPDAAISASLSVEETTAGGVPVTWLQGRLQAKGVLVVLHGGAWLSGPTPDEWRWAAHLASRCGVAVAMVLYRF